ncbi:hypothetical protein [Streptomyces sp. NPDC058451]|uniref:hypothetical protein n=1 Tax=Streptomyces sp. NPDC058451 TaxID=3346506 RepID=UPI003652FF0F
MGKDEGSMADEEWERFLREAEAGTKGAPEEPSARARMVARRLREETGPPEPWRGHQPARRRGGKVWYAAGLLVAVALLVVALDPGRVAGWFGGGGAGAGAGGESTPLAVESQRPDQAPPTEGVALLPTIAHPFRGSPAVRWGDGTAGIGMPEARATGWMSKAEVARTLERTRDFLAASSLDPGVLRGERPRKAIALINPHQPDVKDCLATAFRAPSQKNDPLLLFSRFDTTKVRLVGDVVKVRGRITYREGDRGAVEVTTDVTYVYPVAPAAAGIDEVARTIVRREVVMSWDDPVKVVVDPGTFSLVSYKVDTANSECGVFNGYFTPRFGSDPVTSPPRNGPEVDPYDRSASMEKRMREGCGTVSRS